MSGASGHPRRHLAFAAVAMGTYMSALDASVVNIALPTLAADFGADLDQVEWVVLAYLLTLVTFLLNAGKFADRVGTRWAYGVGLVVFGVTSALCGLSTHFLPLSLARAGQGIGGALMNAAGPAILTDLYPAHQRGRVLGMVGLAVSGGLASGPAVGGLIISALSWHWIFFVNVPIAACAATVAFRVIPARRPRKEPFDWAGFALLGGALLAFLLALTRASRRRGRRPGGGGLPGPGDGTAGGSRRRGGGAGLRPRRAPPVGLRPRDDRRRRTPLPPHRRAAEALTGAALPSGRSGPGDRTRSGGGARQENRKARSSRVREAAAWASPRAASASDRLRACSSRIRSSTVSSATRRWTMTGRSCPMRWARSAA